MKFFKINIFGSQSNFRISMIILGIIFSIISVNSIGAESKNISPLIGEAKTLINREAQFFKARQTEDWEGIHALQHPKFRKKVSIEEIRYFEGWTTYDYREKAKNNAHISGAAVPTIDYIKAHPHKYDPLGFPVVRRYVWSGDSYLKIKTYSLEKISISKNGKFAKVKINIKGKQRLNPVVVRGDFEFDAKYPLTDYWEKVDGTWVITLLSAPVSLSGSGTLKHYSPNNNSAWKKMDFIEISPEQLKLS